MNSLMCFTLIGRDNIYSGNPFPFIGKGIRVYKFNLDYVASIKWVVELLVNARLLSSTRAQEMNPTECPFKPRSWSKAKSFKGCCSLKRMTMHEVIHELVVGECHEPNSKGIGSAWKPVNAHVLGLSCLSCLEYLNGEGVVRVMIRGFDMAPY
ncbi:hypothetical protein Tco_0907386 [Tanacetum coccineum]|uniref:Uncharacterized protein n=1 Tax=Tanacetum coccineum TaxID=301880 RepID=A0ABQ5CJ49_9ASTR